MGRFVWVLAGVMATVGSAAAQPVPEGPAPEEPSAPEEPATPAGPAHDEQVRFDAGFKAMLRGDFAAASAVFKALASTSTSSERRAASAELARLADELIARGGRLAFGEAPGAVLGEEEPPDAPRGDVVAISEDDSREGGRASFVVTTTLASFYTGFVLLDLFDTDELRTGTAVVMATTAGGVVGSIYGTRGRTMTGGMADAWRVGMFAGAGNALLLAGPLGLYDTWTNRSEKINTFVTLSSWGLATAGLVAADALRPTRGQVTLIETFGIMGITSTTLAFWAAQPGLLGDNPSLGIITAGLDLGLGAGALFGSKLDWSHSRARYVQLGALLGALAGGGTSILIFNEDLDDHAFRITAGITLAGLWGGFALGTHLTRNMAPDYRFRRQGTTAMLAPTRIRSAPGLALTGTF